MQGHNVMQVSITVLGLLVVNAELLTHNFIQRQDSGSEAGWGRAQQAWTNVWACTEPSHAWDCGAFTYMHKIVPDCCIICNFLRQKEKL